MSRFPDYDINEWGRQAQAVTPATERVRPGARSLQDVTWQMLHDLGLQLTASHTTVFSEQIVEILYGGAKSFQENRERLLPRLLKGPVTIAIWRGERRNLALGAKFVIRRCLTASTLTNLIHMDLIEETTIERLTAGWSRR